jgi:hypothetical protein
MVATAGFKRPRRYGNYSKPSAYGFRGSLPSKIVAFLAATVLLVVRVSPWVNSTSACWSTSNARPSLALLPGCLPPALTPQPATHPFFPSLPNILHIYMPHPPQMRRYIRTIQLRKTYRHAEYDISALIVYKCYF